MSPSKKKDEPEKLASLSNDDEYTAACRDLLALKKDAMLWITENFTPKFRSQAESYIRDAGGEIVTYEQKDGLVTWIKGELDRLGVSLICPVTHQPARLSLTARGDFQIAPLGAKHPTISRSDASKLIKNLYCGLGTKLTYMERQAVRGDIQPDDISLPHP